MLCLSDFGKIYTCRRGPFARVSVGIMTSAKKSIIKWTHTITKPEYPAFTGYVEKLRNTFALSGCLTFTLYKLPVALLTRLSYSAA